MDEFDIHIAGMADDRAEPPVARFGRAFNLPEPRAREFLGSLPRVVKRRVPAEQAQRYAQLLYEIGAIFELRPSPIRPVQTIGVSGYPGLPDVDEGRNDVHGALLALPDLRRDDLRSPRFQATVVGTSIPAAAPSATPASAPQQAGPVPPSQPPPAWNPVTAPTLAEKRPPTANAQQTLREAGPADLFAVVDIPAMEAEPPIAALPRTPLAQRLSVDFVTDPKPEPVPIPSKSIWGGIEPARAPAIGARAHGPSGGPSEWLAVGADKYAADFDQLSEPPPAQPEPPGHPPVRDGRPPSRPKGAAAFAVQTTGRGQHAPVPSGESKPEPPFALRLAMRLMLGGSLFLILTSIRHCHVMPTDVEEALAEWKTGGAAPGGAAAAAALGPIALDWLASDMHQVTNGDKDRALGLAQRLKDAGALEVYVGKIMNMGTLQLAGELLVELPSDEAKRKAVLAEHAEVMSSTFGGLGAAVPDPEGSVLRITF